MSSSARLSSFAQQRPARLRELLSEVKSGRVSAEQAALEVGVTKAELLCGAQSALEEAGRDPAWRALSSSSQGAEAGFGGQAEGATLRSRGLFQSVLAAEARAGAIVEDAASAGVLERAEQRLAAMDRTTAAGRLGHSGAWGLAMGAGFISPALIPVGGLLGLAGGLVAGFVGVPAGERVLGFLAGLNRKLRDGKGSATIGGEELAPLQQRLREGSEVERAVLVGVAKDLERQRGSLTGSGREVLREMRRARGGLDPALIGSVDRLRRASHLVKSFAAGKGDDDRLFHALRKLPDAELEEVRPWIHDALHDEKGAPVRPMRRALRELLFAPPERREARVVDLFLARAQDPTSSDGEVVSAKEMSLFLARVDTLPFGEQRRRHQELRAALAHPALTDDARALLDAALRL